MHPVFRLVVDEPDAQLRADAATLSWASAAGSVSAVFETFDTVRMRGDGLGVTIADASDGLTPFTGTYAFVDPIDGSMVFTSYETGRRYRVTVLAGHAKITGDQLLGEGLRSIAVTPEAGGWEAVIEEYETTRPPFVSTDTFDSAAAAVADEFGQYLARVAPRSTGDDTAAAASYVLWSATVAPRGFLRRESVLMSKHWMDKVWSWDHCFNALALSRGLPDQALDQFLVVFDQQDEEGAVPDSVTHSEILTNFVKPPIHGWAFAELRRRSGRVFTAAELQTVYDRLSRWTNFWLERRRVAGSTLPHYQHGNDSGWDNSTMFDADRVLVAPDLAAF
ncbi:MAG: glycogen debranching protein, partial [Pseudolysinimonas sp.]